MVLETLLVALVLTAGLLPLVAGTTRGRSRRLLIALALPFALVTTLVTRAFVRTHPDAPGETEVRDRPIQDPVGGYITSESCKACHPGQYATWHSSYHRTMTQVVTPEAVLGEFGVELEYLG